MKQVQYKDYAYSDMNGKPMFHNRFCPLCASELKVGLTQRHRMIVGYCNSCSVWFFNILHPQKQAFKFLDLLRVPRAFAVKAFAILCDLCALCGGKGPA